MSFNNFASALLAVVVVVKIVVWQAAKVEYDRSGNVSLEALALDNFNDILSNFSALAFASLTRIKQETWWFDPLGGILISCYIIHSWCMTALEQVHMLVGRQADAEFIEMVRTLAEKHDQKAEVSTLRAYHFGPKLLVEIELVMDSETPLEVSHDVAVTLQDSIERLDECERCFVLVDYMRRDHDLHDTQVPVEAKTAKPLAQIPRTRSTSGSLRLRTALSMRRRTPSTSDPSGPVRSHSSHSDLGRSLSGDSQNWPMAFGQTGTQRVRSPAHQPLRGSEADAWTFRREPAPAEDAAGTGSYEPL